MATQRSFAALRTTWSSRLSTPPAKLRSRSMLPTQPLITGRRPGCRVSGRALFYFQVWGRHPLLVLKPALASELWRESLTNAQGPYALGP